MPACGGHTARDDDRAASPRAIAAKRASVTPRGETKAGESAFNASPDSVTACHHVVTSGFCFTLTASETRTRSPRFTRTVLPLSAAVNVIVFPWPGAWGAFAPYPEAAGAACPVADDEGAGTWWTGFGRAEVVGAGIPCVGVLCHETAGAGVVEAGLPYPDEPVEAGPRCGETTYAVPDGVGVLDAGPPAAGMPGEARAPVAVAAATAPAAAKTIPSFIRIQAP